MKILSWVEKDMFRSHKISGENPSFMGIVSFDLVKVSIAVIKYHD
jgi:hypothetical protein